MKKFLALVSIFFTITLFAQKEANYWYFGRNAGVNFNTNPPTALTDGAMNTIEGCSSFSDYNGNLLFYSDGINVYDKNHTLMKYTDGNFANNLKGNPSSTQSGMIIPKPGSSTIYYLFTVDDGLSSDRIAYGLNFYTIDISLNGGLGQLIDEDNDGVFYSDLSDGLENIWTEKVAAVRGKECNTFWIVSASENNNFYAYKIDTNGVNLTPVISKVSKTPVRRGYLKLSPDGTKLAVANQGTQGDANGIVYSFNNSTGVVSNDGVLLLNESLSNNGQPYGVEFSLDSKKLYFSTVSNFRGTLQDPAVTYKLFQFDLTATDIPSSIHSVHSQVARSSDYPEGGFRGALQLGPDGKIYATIPLAYFDVNGDANFLDAIENPNAAASDVIYKKNAINLEGRKATQGLPPFISSLLLPIEITDSINNQVINNQDVQFCIGQTRTITPETITGTNITYEWIFDNGITSSVIANTHTLTLSNVTTANNGTYLLNVNLTDTCGNIVKLEGTFNVDVYKAATANTVENINYCDIDKDGFNSFDFQAEVTPQVLGSTQNSTDFEVVYFNNLQDAELNNIDNALLNPYTNSASTETIFARINNRNAPKACNDITNFTITVSGLPTPQTPTEYRECDDTASGNDTDGLFSEFLLNTKDAEILGSLDPNIYSVSYHTSANAAETSATTDVIDKNTNYTNSPRDTQPIYVRVENINNAACFDATKSFNLEVSTLPVINSPVDLKQCDVDIDGFTDFNLTEAEILISDNYTKETFTYFTSENGAINNTSSDQISNITAYKNQTVNSDTIWARVTNLNMCHRIATVNLLVSTAKLPNTFNRNFNACDDFLDSNGNNNANNNDLDGISAFDFSAADTDIKALFPVGQQITVTYYRNEADALAEQNVITDISNYRNIGYPNTQQIYVRVDNEIDNGCLGLGPYITLTVDLVPVANPATDIELCDDSEDGNNTNGIVQSFDLESQTTSILGNQSSTDFNVTYHLTAEDANTGNNSKSSPFENTIPKQQTIYVRVTNKTTKCFTDHNTFNVIVNPLPIANPVEDIEVCDDDSDGSARNGFSQNINLEVQTPTVLGTQDPNQYSVTYHNSLTAAKSGANPLMSPFSNSTVNTQTIYVRIFNNTTQCINATSNFNVVINNEPLANPDNTLGNLSECDDDNNGTTSDTDGIFENFNLESQIPSILGTNQNTANFEVTFHISKTDATTGEDAKTSPFTNTIATQQTIFVRIKNKTTGCINDDVTFDLIVNPVPDFKVTSPQSICLNRPPLTLRIENPNEIYSYQWKDPNGNNLGTEETQEVSTGGNYTVTATKIDTANCSKTRTITVKDSNIATIKEKDITIVDDSDNNSITIHNENDNLGVGDYEFSLIDNQGNTIVQYQDEPLFDQLEGGIYTILVRDKNGCGIANLTVPIIEFPKFFTPNGDGIKDSWFVKGTTTAFFKSSIIHIFNRQGKVLAEIPLGYGWNGIFNGRQAPANEYWFTVQLEDINGNIRNKSGNFSLLR